MPTDVLLAMLTFTDQRQSGIQCYGVVGGGIVLYWLEEAKLIFCLLVIATLTFMSVGALMITCGAVLLCMEKQKLLIDTRCGLQSVLLNLALTNHG
jgi:hypothetical protein